MAPVGANRFHSFKYDALGDVHTLKEAVALWESHVASKPDHELTPVILDDMITGQGTQRQGVIPMTEGREPTGDPEFDSARLETPEEVAASAPVVVDEEHMTDEQVAEFQDAATTAGVIDEDAPAGDIL